MAAFQPPRAAKGRALRLVGRDYVPELRDALAVVAVASAAASGPAARAVLGSTALGYAVATLAEYALHRWAGHEGGRPIRPVLRRLGWVGAWVSGGLEATRLGHLVFHHAKTSGRHYTTPSAPSLPGDRPAIKAELVLPEAISRYIRGTGYGLTLGHSGVMAGLLAPLPVHAALIWTLALDPVAAGALVAPSLLYVAASKWLHPRLHLRRDEALATAGPLARWFLRTRYAEWISRSHWIHHKGGGGNFNLVPGADLLFGDYRRPDLRLFLRMRGDGILGADWSVSSAPSARDGVPVARLAGEDTPGRFKGDVRHLGDGRSGTRQGGRPC